jgi:hypothetical protein
MPIGSAKTLFFTRFIGETPEFTECARYQSVYMSSRLNYTASGSCPTFDTFRMHRRIWSVFTAPSLFPGGSGTLQNSIKKIARYPYSICVNAYFCLKSGPTHGTRTCYGSPPACLPDPPIRLIRLISAANDRLRSNGALIKQAFKATGLPVERMLRNRVT